MLSIENIEGISIEASTKKMEEIKKADQQTVKFVDQQEFKNPWLSSLCNGLG